MNGSFLSTTALVLTGLLAASAQAQTGKTIVTETLEPQSMHITVDKLPKAFATESTARMPKIVDIPANSVLKVPKGFQVSVYAANFKKPRWLAISPEGDLLVTETNENRIRRLRDTNKDGIVDDVSMFATKENGLNQGFGMAFGKDAFYLGNTDGVVKFDYQKGQGELLGTGQKIVDLPPKGRHWTRNVALSPDESWLYVAVGSASNVDADPLPRGAVMRMRPDGKEQSIFAHGLRNPIGIAFKPGTDTLFATVQERDEIGDDLVPDYFTTIKKDGFYGWPFAYMTPQNLDPRRMKNGTSENAALAAKTLTPEVLFGAHSAVMSIAFPQGAMFPERYRNGAFVTMRGSWNRSAATGYKIVFVPFENGAPAGVYEDFLTGFLLDPVKSTVWGRPVGSAFLPDGSYVFTDEENGRIYRVTFAK